MLALLTSGFTVKSKIINNIVGYALKKSVGLGIVAEEIDLSKNKIHLRNAVIKDAQGNLLASIKRADIGFDFSKRELTSFKISGGDFYLTLNLNKDNEVLNWALPFNGYYSDYSETPSEFNLPSLPDIEIDGLNFHFTDYSNKDITFERVIYNTDAVVSFDGNNNILYIKAKSTESEAEYLVDISVAKEDLKVALNFKNVDITPDLAAYTRSKDFLLFNSGKANADIDITKKDVKGRIEVKDTLMSLMALPDTQISCNGFCKIENKSSILIEAETLMNKDSVNIEIDIDLNSDNVLIKAKSLDLKMDFLDKLTYLKSFNTKIDGRAAVNLLLNVNLDNLLIDIKSSFFSKNASIFNQQIRKGSLEVRVGSFLELLKINTEFIDNEFIDVSLVKKGSNYNVKAKANSSSELLQIFNISLPEIKGKVNAVIDGDLDFTNFNLNADLLSSNIFIGSNEFTISAKKSSNDLTLNISNSHFSSDIFIEPNILKIESESKKAKFDYLNIKGVIDGTLSLLQNRNFNKLKTSGSTNLSISDLNIMNIDMGNINIVSQINENIISIKPIDIKISFNNSNYLALKDLRIRGLIEEKALAFDIGSKEVSSLSVNGLSNTSNNFKSQLIVSSNIISVNIIKNDFLSIEGDIDLKNISKSNLSLNIDKLSIANNIFFKNLKAIYLDNSFQVKDGDFVVKSFAFPISAVAELENNKFRVKSFSIAGNSVNGVWGDNLDLIVDVSTKYNFSSRFEEALILGKIFITGSMFNPVVLGELEVNSSILNGRCKISYFDKSISFSSLYLYNSFDSLKVDIDKGAIDLSQSDFELKFNINEFQSSILSGVKSNIVSSFNIVNNEEEGLKYFINSDISNINDRGFRIDLVKIDMEGTSEEVVSNKINIINNNTSLDISLKYIFKDSLYDIFIKNDLEINNISFEKLGLSNLSFYINADINLTNNNKSGQILIKRGGLKLNLEKIIGLNSKIDLRSDSSSVEIQENLLEITFNGKINQGEISSLIKYDLNSNKHEVVTDIKKANIGVSGYLNTELSTNFKLDNYILSGDLKIHSGILSDILIPEIPSNNKKSKFNIEKFNIEIEKGFKVTISTLAIFNLIDLDIKGNLTLFKDFENAGLIEAEKGLIKFNKNDFKISNFSLKFEENTLMPDISIFAENYKLENRIFLELRGNLANREVLFVNDFDNPEEIENKIAFTLFSPDNLTQGEILYLLSVGEGKSFLDSGFSISNQALQSLLLNPISQKLKNTFGFTKFNISGGFFDAADTSNTITTNNEITINPLANLNIELLTNVYKNRLFLGSLINFAGSGALEKVRVDLSTLNRWSFFFSFFFSSDRILERLGFSKQLNFGKHNLTLGVSNLENILYFNSLNLQKTDYLIEWELRF